jgi:hypothetical protein
MTKVLIGANGRLFLDNDSNNVNAQHKGELLLSENQIESWKSLLHSRNVTLAKSNIKYLHFVSPDSQAIYPEDLPYCTGETRPVMQLKESGLFDKDYFIYPHKRLLIGKASGKIIYPDNDTHWSPYGAYLGCLEVFARLQEMGISTNNTISERIVVERKLYLGDLGNKLMPNQESLIDSISIMDEQARLSFYNGIEVSGKFQVFVNANSDLPTAMIFGTSFTYAMLRILKEAFGKLIFIHSTSVDYCLVDEIKPDIVVTEIPERFMGSPPNDDKPYLRSDLIQKKLSQLNFSDVHSLIADVFNYRNIGIPNSIRLNFAKEMIPYLKEGEISFGDYALLRRKEGSKKLLIAFSGGGTTRKNFNYYRQYPDFQDSILFLNTTPELYYHSGIPGLGETESEMLESLEFILTFVNITSGIYTFGVSQGGWGALSIGVRLNAKRIFALGARHPIYTPLLFNNDSRSELIESAKDVTAEVFTSKIDKIMFYGDSSWHDMKSFNYYRALYNCNMKMFGNLPHNLAIHFVNNSELRLLTESFVNDQELDVSLPETSICDNYDIVNSIYEGVYSEVPSLKHASIYSTIKNAGFPLGSFEISRTRLALGELHEKLGDKKSAMGNYKLSLESCITLPALSGLLALLFDLAKYDEAVDIFDEYSPFIKFKDQERDEVGKLFQLLLRSINEGSKTACFEKYYEKLKLMSGWAFGFPPLERYLKDCE